MKALLPLQHTAGSSRGVGILGLWCATGVVGLAAWLAPTSAEAQSSQWSQRYRARMQTLWSKPAGGNFSRRYMEPSDHLRRHIDSGHEMGWRLRRQSSLNVTQRDRYLIVRAAQEKQHQAQRERARREAKKGADNGFFGWLRQKMISSMGQRPSAWNQHGPFGRTVARAKPTARGRWDAWRARLASRYRSLLNTRRDAR